MAQETVDEVLVQSPNDPYTLFLSARICRTRNDSAREAESLEKLVAIGEKSGLSTVDYRIYLGQAYARQSLAEPALQNYRAAINSGQLNSQQAEEVQDAIKSIESKRTP
jgi:predicted Zn-dependent protease